MAVLHEETDCTEDKATTLKIYRVGQKPDNFEAL